MRIPTWCTSSPSTGQRQGGNQPPYPQRLRGRHAEWRKGDRLELQFKLQPRVIVGDHKNQGKVAVLYGPLVLAADEALLGATNRSLNAVSMAGADLPALAVEPEPAPASCQVWPGAQVFR